MWDFIQSLGGLAVIVTASAGVAFALFRLLSEQWLLSKFNERLEALKHAQQQEIEVQRSRFTALMDRTTKLHQREYDALPLLWEKLASANAEVGAFVSAFQSYTDVGRMNDAQLEEFLAGSDLTETQKEAVRHVDAGSRTNVFIKEQYWHRKATVNNVLREFTRYLKFNGIFVLPTIKEKAAGLDKLLWDALIEHTGNHEHEIIPRERSAAKALDAQGQLLMSEIEALVQERLWTVTEIN